MQIRCRLFPCSKQLFLIGTNLFSHWEGWCGSVEPLKVASLSPMMMVKPRNQRARRSPQSVPLPHTYTHSKVMSTSKVMNSRKFPVDWQDRSANWTIGEWRLPKGMWNKQPPTAMLCFCEKVVRLFHKNKCEKEERGRGGDEGDTNTWKAGNNM